MALLLLPHDLLFKELFPQLSVNELLPLRRSSSDGRKVVDRYKQWDLSKLWPYYSYLTNYSPSSVRCRYSCPYCPNNEDYKYVQQLHKKVGRMAVTTMNPHYTYENSMKDHPSALQRSYPVYRFTGLCKLPGCPCPFCGIDLSPTIVALYHYTRINIIFTRRRSPDCSLIMHELLNRV